MSLPCKIVEDLLPIYYDGVCSEESEVLVDEHLTQCFHCSELLDRLRAEPLPQGAMADSLTPLKKIRRQWKKTKYTALLQGIGITVVVLLLGLGVLSGIWYFDYGIHYFRMAEQMEPTPREDAFFTSSDYTIEKDGYRFEIWMPIVMGYNGFARVMDEHGLVLFLYPQSKGECESRLVVTDADNQSWTVYLNSDLTPNFEEHPFPVRSEEEKAHICELIAQQYENIRQMQEAIRGLWNMDLTQ